MAVSKRCVPEPLTRFVRVGFGSVGGPDSVFTGHTDKTVQASDGWYEPSGVGSLRAMALVSCSDVDVIPAVLLLTTVLTWAVVG